MKKAAYDHKSVEQKWVERWYDANLYAAKDFDTRPKKYIMAEFPYPSGTGLHCGHLMRFTMPDVYSRKLRMSGYNVLFPIGWDAFGLPAENFAVKTGVHPKVTTADAVATYKRQMRAMGMGFDWAREINTTDPDYYKWTQWFFLKFFEQGLAEFKEEPVWWCEDMKTVLANEEVIKDTDGNLVSERGEKPVEKRMLRQWILKMPEYADKLIEGLSKVDFPESIKNAQINWIGRKEGINITYPIKDQDITITVFTTRPDTNFGATFVVAAPDSEFVEQNLASFPNKEEAEAYVATAKKKSELERISEGRAKTGVFTGWYAVNHLTGKEMPIYITDFVLASVGTGCVVGVPGHDIRDFEFAKAKNLEIVRVVVGSDGDTSPIVEVSQVQEEEGTMINSDFLDGLDIHEATTKIMDYLVEKGWGEKTVTYKLRNWLFSRQRYWGEPIPVVHKEEGSIEAIVDTKDMAAVHQKLPLELPEVPDFRPTDDAMSPLAKNTDWVNTTDREGNPAQRETNTMPNWAGSCWYYLRYLDPRNNDAFADMDKMKYWLPVDRYFGGNEHTTLHLLYSRFWHKFFYDLGLVPTEEPYQWRLNGGILLGSDGRKMSKSIGNVINPDEKAAEYGADALRLYINFMGPYDGTIAWAEGGIKACRRLVDDICALGEKVSDAAASEEEEVAYNKLVKNVSEMIDDLHTNTAVSEFMIFINSAKTWASINKDTYKGVIKLFAPFAPFISEELWQEVNEIKDWTSENSVHLQEWPKFDPEKVKSDTITVGVQVNGKRRAEVEVSESDTEESVRAKLESSAEIQKRLEGKKIKKVIYVPMRIVNVVLE